MGERFLVFYCNAEPFHMGSQGASDRTRQIRNGFHHTGENLVQGLFLCFRSGAAYDHSSGDLIHMETGRIIT